LPTDGQVPRRTRQTPDDYVITPFEKGAIGSGRVAFTRSSQRRDEAFFIRFGVKDVIGKSRGGFRRHFV
jgi:hypothetical protein